MEAYFVEDSGMCPQVIHGFNSDDDFIRLHSNIVEGEVTSDDAQILRDGTKMIRVYPAYHGGWNEGAYFIGPLAKENAIKWLEFRGATNFNFSPCNLG